jgi:arginine decarboxylase
VFHLQGKRIDFPHLSACADLLMTTSPNVLLYAAIDGWRRQMVERGTELLQSALELAHRLRSEIDRLPGMHVLEDELLGAEASSDLDRLQIMIDLSELGISGYQAADWLREQERIDMHLSDHARTVATVSISDSDSTAERLLQALKRLSLAAEDFPEPRPIKIPDPPGLELETVNRPRDAFFSEFEDVTANDAVGRIAAEQITPYPPGIPVILPGERINQEVIDYLLSGLDAGMTLPDPADPSLKTIRVMQ